MTIRKTISWLRNPVSKSTCVLVTLKFYSLRFEETLPMGIPNLKRINVYSEQEPEVWLTKHSSQEESIMVVTHTSAIARRARGLTTFFH
jgi:hypothetical protein